mgnify:CR=1 FL=1
MEFGPGRDGGGNEGGPACTEALGPIGPQLHPWGVFLDVFWVFLEATVLKGEDREDEAFGLPKTPEAGLPVVYFAPRRSRGSLLVDLPSLATRFPEVSSGRCAPF